MTSDDPWIHWLGGHPESYFWLAGVVIAVVAAIALRPFLRETTADAKRHDWVWGLAILAILIAGRWPTFLFPRELNPDESFMLAGAHAFLHDPVFWRSVDGHTSGPLSFMVLWPAGELFGWVGFLPTRGTSLALLALSFTLLHQCLALVTGVRVARLCILGAVVFEALTNSANFLHYSTELMPIALLAGAGYAAVRRWTMGGSVKWNLLGGLLLGAVPLTKLQAVPLAAVAGLGWLVAEFVARRTEGYRPKVLLVSAALLPVALFALQITLTGEWPNVLIPYFLYNVLYAGQAQLAQDRLVVATLRYFVTEDSLLHLWLGGSLLWMLLILRRRQSPDRAVRTLIVVALIAVALAIWTALFPGRAFVHYWQFTILPFCLLTGALTANMLAAPPQPWVRSRRLLVVLCFMVTLGAMLAQRAQNTNRLMRTIEYREAFPMTALSARVAVHTRPGEALAIWGWTGSVYVEAGLRQGARDSNTERLIDDSPYRQFYRDRYLADLRKNRPEWFLDSVGPTSPHYTTREFAHELQYPELAAFIQANYVLAEQIDEARLYRRRDLPGR